MMRSGVWSLPVVAVLLTACVTPGSSTLEYTPPQTLPIQTQIEIQEGAEAVWARLIQRLTGSAFVIRNINQFSRVISVSFTMEAPERYVDCGSTRREFSFREESEVYEYVVAEPSHFRAASTWGTRNQLASVLYLQRKTELEGQATIHVASRGAYSSVSTTAQFRFASHTMGVANGYSRLGRLVRTEPIDDTQPGLLRFGTHTPTSADWGGVEVTCLSKGRLEAELLERAAAH